MILSVGLTPAWQQVLVFDQFTLGEVNRAQQVLWNASGKVLNANRVAHLLGGPARALTIVGGASGQAIREDCARHGLAVRFVEADSPTRICTTIVERDRSVSTELVPNAAQVTQEERQAFLAAWPDEARTASMVLLIGSLPAGTPATFYHTLMQGTKAPVLLDARGPELLAALPARPFLVKPNRTELAQTVGRSLRTDAEVWDAMRELNERGAQWVVITDGAQPVRVSTQMGCYVLHPPPVSVVNPIGCGDSLAAGTAWALDQGQEPIEAIRFGLAAAADKIGRLLPGVVDAARVHALVSQVRVERRP